MENKLRNKISNQTALTLWMLALLGVIMLVLAIAQPTFLTANNLRNVINQNALLIIASMAVTMLMITGNFDLSIGAVIAMSGVLCAWFCQAAAPYGGANLPYGVAVLLALLISAGIGLVNSFLVVKLGVASVIATLGTMSIARGIAYIGANGSMVELGVPSVFKVIGRAEVGSFFTLPTIIMIVVVLIFVFVEMRTVFGQRIFFIGANKKAAELSGIKVGKHISTLFVVSGVLSGFAGIMLASKLGAGDCKVGAGYEFDAVVAIILGGTSIAGGSGTVLGTVIGVFIIGILSNALNLFGAGTEWQAIVKGLAIVGAILFQRFATSKRSIRA